MGHIGEKYSDCMWITSDNPRDEDPKDIIEDIVKGVRGGTYRIEPDRRCAIEEAIGEAREGDVVLIAGKGHEGVQVFSDRVIPFDDRDVVREVLARSRAVDSIPGKEAMSGKEKVYVGVSLA